MKIGALNEVESSCDCDTEDVGDACDVDDGRVFHSDNSRPMLYETWDVSGESSVLVSTSGAPRSWLPCRRSRWRRR